MSKRKEIFYKAVILGCIFTDILIGVSLFVLATVLLIAPSIVVFAHGYDGIWLLLTFIFAAPLYGFYLCCESIVYEWRELRK